MATLTASGTRFYFACDRIPYAATERLLATTFEVVCLRVDLPFRELQICGDRISAEELPEVISLKAQKRPADLSTGPRLSHPPDYGALL